MKRALGDEEEAARTLETYEEGELTLRRSLEEYCSLFFSPARDALVALLLAHGKDEQAAALMHGELTLLELNSCKIGDDGAEIVADFLKHDETVKTVYLYSCNIGPRGAKAIAGALKHNLTLEEMYLVKNPIGDEGAEALIEALNYNVCIKLLYVTETSPELEASIEFLAETRNKIIIPAAVRRASLYLIGARRNIAGAGILAIFPKEIVKMIAMEVWATQKDSIWINALTESERTGKSGDE
jgi:hypothetical protein